MSEIVIRIVFHLPWRRMQKEDFAVRVHRGLIRDH